MSNWTVKRTDTFSKFLKKHKNNHELIQVLDTKIIQLRKEPHIGGKLSGKLHGKKSTRLVKRFRLILVLTRKIK
ncbi:MAG: hypothetical protein CMH61_01030 [Nanoarchaeota archaeon]|nr:hypothetical protein [Nanoarchaeota archaeon]|tara:strand:- start:627 stop:848 length:222 start_codon:yes stop_codon:yes gene_type:complete